MHRKVEAEVGGIDERDLDTSPASAGHVSGTEMDADVNTHIWSLDEGETAYDVRAEKESLYYVVEGTVSVETDADSFEVGEGAFFVSHSDGVSRIVARERSEILVVRTPCLDELVAEGTDEARRVPAPSATPRML